MTVSKKRISIRKKKQNKQLSTKADKENKISHKKAGPDCIKHTDVKNKKYFLHCFLLDFKKTNKTVTKKKKQNRLQN